MINGSDWIFFTIETIFGSQTTIHAIEKPMSEFPTLNNEYTVLLCNRMKHKDCYGIIATMKRIYNAESFYSK